MQRHVTDCCGTAVITRSHLDSWERFDVTMPPSSFGLTPSLLLLSFSDIPRDFRQRVVNELAQY